MGKEIIAFGNIGVEKHQFHQNKNPILIYDVNIGKIIVPIKFSFAKKGFKKC